MNLDDNPYVAPRPIDPREGRVKPGTIPPSNDEGPPVIVRFRMTPDEIVAARREHARHLSPLRPLIIVLGAVAGLITFSGLVAVTRTIMGEEVSPRPYPGAVICFLVGIYWFTIRPPINRWHIRRTAQRLYGESDVEWRIWPGHLESEAKLMRSPSQHGAIESITHSTIGWEGFVNGARTEAGILLSPSPSLFHWLPRHGFADEDDYGRVAAWAREKIHKFIDSARK